MKDMRIKILITAFLVFSISSCSSFYMKKSQETAEEIVESLNRGDSLTPLEFCVLPFVFDGEIVLAETSISRIWTGLTEAGFVLENPVVTSISPILESDFALFRSSWEMEMFFKKYFPEFSYKVTIEGINGEVTMLISRISKHDYSLIGIKADSK